MSAVFTLLAALGWGLAGYALGSPGDQTVLAAGGSFFGTAAIWLAIFERVGR